MISEAIINLGIVGVVFLILLLYLIRFVLRYKHEYESNPLCTLTVLFCLLVVLLMTFVLPVDIFLVSFVKEPDGTFKEWATNETMASIDKAVFATYYTFYGIITLLIFVVIPFLHFFNEETESNSQDRLHNAIKYTFGFILILTVILLAGAFTTIKGSNSEIFDKIIHIVETTKLQDSLNMVLAIITTAGLLNVIFYTASGIFSWPIGMILGTSSVANRFDTVTEREIFLRMRISTLQEKARVSRLTPTEQKQLADAEDDLRGLEREEIALSGYSETFTYRFRKAIRPLQVITGSVFGLLSIFLVVTLIMVNIDRILHGAGPKQGYVLLRPEIFNPLEYVYMKTQALLFIGPMPLIITTCFILVATISGIRNLGLWLLFARLYRIKVGRTPPQALLFFCITLMLAALAFNLTLYSMTSQYLTFGNQNFKTQGANGTAIVKPCSLDDYHQDCILTRSSILLMRMMAQMWIFGAIFYWASWAFVLVACLSFIAYLIRGRRDATHGIISDNDEEFEE